MEKEWEQIKMTITEAANEIIKKKIKKRRSEWWDEDCQLAIRRKNEAGRKWLQHRTRASREWYHKKRNEANRLCASKKKEWINDTIRQIEENHKRNESMKFFFVGLRNPNSMTQDSHICVKVKTTLSLLK